MRRGDGRRGDDRRRNHDEEETVLDSQDISSIDRGWYILVYFNDHYSLFL